MGGDLVTPNDEIEGMKMARLLSLTSLTLVSCKSN